MKSPAGSQVTAFISGLALAVISSSTAIARNRSRLEAVFEWNKFHYNITSQISFGRGDFVYREGDDLMGDVRYHNGFLYLAVPRLRDDTIPATLNRIDFNRHYKTELSPWLTPYPSLSMNSIGSSCRTLQNVLAMDVSPDGRLWVADSGVAAVFSNPIRKCPAKLVVFDLKNEKNPVSMSYSFPEAVVSSDRKKSILLHMVLDLTLGPGNEFVYISDMAVGKLIVFDVKRKRSWSLTAKYMMPKYSKFSFKKGQSMSLRSGIAGLALESNRPANRLLFSTFGHGIFAVPSNILRFSSKWTRVDKYVKWIGMKNSASDGMTFDNKGRLYYSEQEYGAVKSWNSSNYQFVKGRGGSVIARSDSEFQWINCLFVQDSFLWIISNRFHHYIYQDLDLREANFKIFRLPLKSDDNSPIHSYTANYDYVSGTSETRTLYSTLTLAVVLTNIIYMYCLSSVY